jgi:hypothetical protein
MSCRSARRATGSRVLEWSKSAAADHLLDDLVVAPFAADCMMMIPLVLEVLPESRPAGAGIFRG